MRRWPAAPIVGFVALLLGGCEELDQLTATRAPEAPLAVVAIEEGGSLVERDGGYYLERPGALPLTPVERVIDGDTVAVRAGGEELLVRVFGLAAPERGERCYMEAAEQLRHLVGPEVGMLADEREQDRFGRPLRYLFTPEGRSVDADMVSAGVAEAWHDDGALRDQLVALERAAQVAGRGCLWAEG